jgi:hypothetical protein
MSSEASAAIVCAGKIELKRDSIFFCTSCDVGAGFVGGSRAQAAAMETLQTRKIAELLKRLNVIRNFQSIH